MDIPFLYSDFDFHIEHSFESPIPVFHLVKAMHSRKNPGFAAVFSQEMATLPCIARKKSEKRAIRSGLSFEGLYGWSMGKLRIGVNCNQDIVISIL